MKFNHYIMPPRAVLRDEGYIPQHISPKISDEIYRMLTMIGSPFARYAIWYKKRYRNVYDLSRKAISVYVYGISNLAQFGGEEKEVAYHAMKICCGDVMDKYSAFSGEDVGKFVRFNRRFVDQCIDILIDALDKEAREHIERMSGAVVPYWFEKKTKVQRTVKLHKSKFRGGNYRIEKYADMYD